MVLAAVAAVAFGAQAEAQQRTITTPAGGYNYFNRPGATIEEHFADLSACRDAIEGRALMARVGSGVGAAAGYYYAPSPGPTMPTPVAGAVAVGFAAAAVDAAIDARRIRNANFENCMVVRGWRVARLDDEQGRALDALDRPALAAALAPLVGAEDAGVIRTFGNEAVLPETTILEPPEPFDQVSLSVQALADRPEPTAEERRAEREAQRAAQRALPRFPRTAYPPQPISERNIAALPETATLVVIHVVGPMRGSGFIFTRESADERPAWVDGQPEVFVAAPPMRMVAPAGVTTSEKTLVFSVPPGRWRFAGMFAGQSSMSTCLGAPSFEIHAGEVLYAGDFYINDHMRGPDLSGIERARGALATAPALAARLQAAQYRNGDMFTCSGAYLYAYEVDGAPFVEGYHFGSRAGALSEQQATTPSEAPAAPTAP